MSAVPNRVIQADDLTGAADTAVSFAEAGERTVVVPWRGGGSVSARLDRVADELEPECLAADTAGRHAEPDEAARRAGDVARWAVGRGSAALYKKVDSVLRGHPDAELHGVLKALGDPPLVVVAPAYPALGRTTADGQQQVHGRPLETGGDLVARLGLDRTGAPIRHVAIEELRRGLALAGGARFMLVDAELAADLDLLAEALERSPASPLLVGSGGLATALAARLPGDRAERGDAPAPRRRLIVSVSRTRAAAAQVERLRELLPDLVDARLDLGALGAGDDAVRAEVRRAARLASDALGAEGDALLGVTATAGGREESALINRALAEVVALAVARERPELIVANGGDSALAVCVSLGVDALLVKRALPAGAVCSATHGRPDPPLTLVTKSGGFGEPGALAELCGALRREPVPSGGR